MSKKRWVNQFQTRIIQLCMDNDISFRELSTKLGYSQNYIQQIVSGKNLPSMTGFFEICIFFSITPADFFKDGDCIELFSQHFHSTLSPTTLQYELIIELLEILDKKGIR